LGAPTEIGTDGLFVRIADPSGTLFGVRQGPPDPGAFFGLPAGA